LTQLDLARRWRISPRTLERWRWLRQGPAYLKLGAVITYRLQDVEAFEARQRHEAAATSHTNSASSLFGMGGMRVPSLPGQPAPPTSGLFLCSAEKGRFFVPA
jgi:hypothetical protein